MEGESNAFFLVKTGNEEPGTILPFLLTSRGGEGGVLSDVGYIGMCGPQGYGFFSRFGLK